MCGTWRETQRGRGDRDETQKGSHKMDDPLTAATFIVIVVVAVASAVAPIVVVVVVVVVLTTVVTILTLAEVAFVIRLPLP